MVGRLGRVHAPPALLTSQRQVGLAVGLGVGAEVAPHDLPLLPREGYPPGRPGDLMVVAQT